MKKFTFIFVEHDVFYKVRPIYSAIDINLFENIDKTIGSKTGSSIYLIDTGASLGDIDKFF